VTAILAKVAKTVEQRALQIRADAVRELIAAREELDPYVGLSFVIAPPPAFRGYWAARAPA
jgi:hypothetical protein